MDFTTSFPLWKGDPIQAWEGHPRRHGGSHRGSFGENFAARRGLNPELERGGHGRYLWAGGAGGATSHCHGAILICLVEIWLKLRFLDSDVDLLDNYSIQKYDDIPTLRGKSCSSEFSLLSIAGEHLEARTQETVYCFVIRSLIVRLNIGRFPFPVLIHTDPSI